MPTAATDTSQRMCGRSSIDEWLPGPNYLGAVPEDHTRWLLCRSGHFTKLRYLKPSLECHRQVTRKRLHGRTAHDRGMGLAKRLEIRHRNLATTLIEVTTTLWVGD